MNWHEIGIVVSTLIGCVVGAILGIRSAVKQWEKEIRK